MLARDRGGFLTNARLSEMYGPLAAWTRWWLTRRDQDGDGVPQYNHGNDCGWDNSTAYDIGFPVESPDLGAFLVLQMDVLADLAHRLGRGAEAHDWTRQANGMLDRTLAHSWRGDRFVAPQSGTHRTAEGDSLLLFLPLVLGPRLPHDVSECLVAGLRRDRRFLTEWGLATESVSSPLYEPDGYWRGPIWAPPTLLLADGLAALSEQALAIDIARRFCRLAAHSGAAENFDARTGAGLRDRAYTWTASVFLILARDFLKRPIL